MNLFYVVSAIVLILLSINWIVEIHTSRIIKAIYELKAQQWKDSQK